jgi:hypothetical protein
MARSAVGKGKELKEGVVVQLRGVRVRVRVNTHDIEIASRVAAHCQVCVMEEL